MSNFRTITAASKIDPSRKILVKGPGGHNLCRFCKTEVVPPRRTFCSGSRTRYSHRKINGIRTKGVYVAGSGCVHEWCLRNSPKYAREAVFDRDQGVCSFCQTKNSRKGAWQADHIIPVAEGGGECGLENFRTLCVPCHKIVTKELHSRLVLKRKLLKSDKDNSGKQVEHYSKTHVLKETCE